MRKNQKLDLKIGDAIECRDIDTLYDWVRRLTVWRYDTTVDEKELTITIVGIYETNGNKKSKKTQ